MVKSRHIVAAAAGVVATACILSGPASATPPEGDSQRTDLGKGTTDTPISIATNGEETAFYVSSLTLAPGASSGWHAHPGPEQTVVTKGAVVLQTSANCVPTDYAAGQAIFVPAGVAHTAKNIGTEDAVVTVVWTLPADATVREDVPAACP